MDTPKKDLPFVQRFMSICNALGCPVEVIGYEESSCGISLDVKPISDIKVIDFLKIRDDIALRLDAYYIQVIPPEKGKWKLKVNILMEKPAGRSLEECIAVACDDSGGLSLCLGHGITDKPVMLHLEKYPSVLVAGTAGDDVSCFIRTMEAEIAASTTLTGIEAIHAEGEFAYGILTDFCHRIGRGDSIRRSVVLIDRYEDLIRENGYKAEELIYRLLTTRKTDALHFVIATSCPTVDVITGVISSNVQAKIAFRVSDSIQSRTIIRTGGAECLVGQGEALLVTTDARNPRWFRTFDVAKKTVKSMY